MEELPGCMKPIAYAFFILSAILLIAGLITISSGKREHVNTHPTEVKKTNNRQNVIINTPSTKTSYGYDYYEPAKSYKTPEDVRSEGHVKGYEDGYYAGIGYMDYYDNYDDNSEYYNYYGKMYEEGYSEGYEEGYYNSQYDR